MDTDLQITLLKELINAIPHKDKSMQVQDTWNKDNQRKILWYKKRLSRHKYTSLHELENIPGMEVIWEICKFKV
jgi:hypothetical protein